MNANDPTARFYFDAAYQTFKGPEVTNAEIALIENIALPQAKILDVGCGTGRHMIPLSEKGFVMTGIDSSSGMLKVLQQKLPTAVFHETRIEEFATEERFDLIILMWNAWNEIVLDELTARTCLKKFKQVLSTGGKVLINIDEPSLIPSFPNFDYTGTFISEGGEENTIDWKVLNFNPETNTTISQETITTVNGDLVTAITQRWWNYDQMSKMAAEFGFSCQNLQIRYNAENYILLSL